MANNAIDAEKAYRPYTDDENGPAKTVVELPHLTAVTKRSRWPSWKTIILLIVIVALVLARLVEGLVKVQWRHRNHNKPVTPIPTAVSPSEVEQVQVYQGPGQLEDVSKAVPSHPVNILPAPTHGADLNVQTKDGAVSVAASVDGDGSRQIYDIDTAGVIRIRKIQNETYRYTPAEVVPTSQKPKAGTPLSALAWRAEKLSIEHRLYYVNTNGNLVELAGKSENATATTTWNVKIVIGGQYPAGLVAINIGPSYDPATLAGQIRVFFVNDKGEVQVLNTLNDKWYINFSKFTAVPGSDVALNAIRDNSTGQVTDLSVIYVDPKEGLKEFVCDEKNNRNQYFPARPVDPSFPTKSPTPHFAAAFGGPPPVSRIYTLNAVAAVERTGTRAGWYTNEWWQAVDNVDYVPAAAGGPVAAIAWGTKEVRLFYKPKTVGSKIAEIGLSAQIGDGTKWFPRGYVD